MVHACPDPFSPYPLYLYVGDPGMAIYDRDSLDLIAKKSLSHRDLLGVAFSEDGSRYAVATGGRIFFEDLFRSYDPTIEAIVRVVDTLKGNTRAAFPPSTRWIRALTLSPEGDRIAFANADGTIEVWTVP